MLLLIFPSAKLPTHESQRIFGWVSKKFGETPRLVASAETVEHYKCSFPSDEIIVYSRSLVTDCSAAVFMEGPPSSYLDDPRHSDFANQRIYIVSRGCRLDVVNKPINEFDYPFIKTHIFNKEAPINLGYTFFPYGYLYRSPGFGPIDAFGFRIESDYRALANRGPHHKVIAVFGGSSAMSIHCLHEEMFTSILERKLNEHARSAKPANGNQHLEFTVLNFGVLGHAVLNELLTFALFVDRIHPDVVIGHDAYNDFSFGLVNDEFLLNGHSICYEPNFEDWSRLLHQPGCKPNSEIPTALKIRNQPKNVVDSYIFRKLQFKKFAEASGAHFVWAIQPASFSKQAFAPAERQIFEGLASNSAYRYSQTMKVLPRLFDLLTEELTHHNVGQVLRVDQEFREFGSDDCLFVDIVHTNPQGDEAIANCYFRALTPLWYESQT